MRILAIVLLSFVVSCGDNLMSIERLKDDGYTEVFCDSINRKTKDSERFIEINKVFLEEKSFILARCFDNNSCIFDLHVKQKKVVCQRYFIDLYKDSKSNYVDTYFKEFVDHRVLYLSTK